MKRKNLKIVWIILVIFMVLSMIGWTMAPLFR